ncbi:MAG: murein biosynthesis integral membrane protein MurJ [Gammaproteobacteria bacterium]|nr:murein biosynthesis integral membrane protein MurJ [Gammaproteobacteria bacterium]
MSKVLKSTTTVGGMTLISRIFGYLRDVVIAIFFGASGATDAFFVAFRIPNFLRRLFAEGAFSQAFVPIFSEIKEQQGKTDLKDLVDHVTGSLGLVLVALTALGILAAPLLITIFAPGFIGENSRFDLTVYMLRLTFPYLLFISLTAMAGGILNAMGKFAVPAVTPVLLNFSLIGATLWLAPHMDPPITALAVGVFIAGVVQLGFQLPFLYRLGLLPRPRFRTAHKGVRRVMRLMIPALFGTSVVQINLLFDTLIASFLTTGSISWLYFSDRFVELPLALFGIAIATVILPRLSRQHARNHAEEFSHTLDWAMRLALLVTVPAMMGLILLAGPILVSLIQYREFSYADSQMASMSLMAYACGLPAFILIKVLAPGFYSRQDTKTPVRIGIIAMLANMALNVIFVVPWVYFELPGPHTGLALATAASAFINAGLLFRHLLRINIYTLQPGWSKFIRQIFLATVLLTLILVLLTPALSAWNQWGMMQRGSSLAGLICLAAFGYLLTLFIQGIRPRQFLIR